MHDRSTSALRMDETVSVLSRIGWPAGQFLEKRQRSPFNIEGADSQVVYIESGAVMLTVTDREGHESFVGMLLPGDVHTQHDESPLHRTTVLTDVAYHTLSIGAFQSRLDRDPARMRAYAQNVSAQLERTRELFVVCKRHYIVSRLAGLMLWLSKHEPFSSASDLIEFPFQNTDLAAAFSCSREMVSRPAMLLEQKRVIERPSRRQLRILNEPLLQDIYEAGLCLSG